MGISDINEATIDKEGDRVYRKFITQKCRELDETRLRKLATGKQKCDRIMEGTYGKKPYMDSQTIGKVRNYF